MISFLFLDTLANKDVAYVANGLVREKWKKKIDRLMANGEGKCTQLLKKMELLTKGGDEFKRMFVAYSYGVFLAPTTGHIVDMRIVSQIEDVHQIKSLDWCSFVVSHLCQEVQDKLHYSCSWLFGYFDAGLTPTVSIQR